MKYIITLIISIVLFSCSGNTNMNSESKCEPDWFEVELGLVGKIIGKNDYTTKKGRVYGRATSRNFDRNTAKNLATAQARRMLLGELEQKIVADLVEDKISDLDYGDGNLSESFTKKIVDNMSTTISGTCKMCNLIKSKDCYNNGKWDSFALVEYDIDKYLDKDFQTLYEAAFNQLTKEKSSGGASFNAPTK